MDKGHAKERNPDSLNALVHGGVQRQGSERVCS